MRDLRLNRSDLARPATLIALSVVSALLASIAVAADPPAKPVAPVAQIASPANPVLPPANVVYKWKDAHGISQYSQQPPPKGVKFDVIQNAAPATNNDAKN